MRRWIAGAFAIGLLLGLAPAARAAGRDPVLAEQLFRDGRKAIEAGDLKTACAKFAESYRLDPAPGTLLNLGDCEERRGQLASAWEHFNQLHDTLPANDDRRSLARSRADSVAARVPHLRIALDKSVPADATIQRDGVAVDRAAVGVAVPVDPGKHTLVVRAPDRADWSTDVTLAIGQQRDVVLEAGKPLPHAVAPPPPPVHHRLGAQRVVGLVVAGAGVAAAGVGGAFGTLALLNENDSAKYCNGDVCTDKQGVDLHETAKTYALVADILFGSAVVLFATGAVIFLTGKHSTEHPTAFVAPAPGGLTFGGTF
jgi:tetratricopeptide (TPR) repeat protein